MGGYMIDLKNYDKYEKSGLTYGGAAGSKLGIIIDEDKWFLKYPKSTKNLEGVDISYSTAPLSEYIASNIYKTIGIETHETALGIASNKVVVACKDFLGVNEILYDFNAIKNSYNPIIEEQTEKFSSSYGICDLEEITLMAKENMYFKKLNKLHEHFWDMFVVDSLIDNHDRNNGNWGIILNRATSQMRIAPVYDNGAAFYNKSDSDKMKNILKDDKKFKQVAYDSARTVFKENGKSLNPLKYIESMQNEFCNNAILRIVPQIDINEIEKIFDEIPERFEQFIVMDKTQKEFYLKILKYRYEEILLPTFKKLSTK